MQPDSTAVAGVIAPALHSFIVSFDGMRPDVADALTKLGTTAGTIAVLTLVRWTMIGFAKGSAVGRTYVAPLWDKNRGWLNPLLAIALGHLDGSALAGALAVAVHSGYRGAAKALGNATEQGVKHAARVSALLFLLCLPTCTPRPARADVAGLIAPITRQSEPKLSPLAAQRFALQFGVGAKASGWVYSRGTTGFFEAQTAYQWTDALGLRAGVRRMAVSRAAWEPEVRLTLTLAP